LVVGLEFFFMGKRESLDRTVCLVFACLGVFFSGKNDVTVTFAGLVTALIAVPPAALYKVLASRFLKGGNYSSASTLVVLFRIGIPTIVVLTPLTDRLGDLREVQWDLGLLGGILGTGLLAASLHFSSLLVLGSTSALGHVLIGQAKSCFLIFFGGFVMGNPTTFRALAWAAVAISSITTYAIISIKASRPKPILPFFDTSKDEEV
jgi:hypothetical protein